MRKKFFVCDRFWLSKNVLIDVLSMFCMSTIADRTSTGQRADRRMVLESGATLSLVKTGVTLTFSRDALRGLSGLGEGFWLGHT